MGDGLTKHQRYGRSPKGKARSARYRATGAHRENQRRYYASGGRHQDSATKAQRRIERYTRDLEALAT